MNGTPCTVPGLPTGKSLVYTPTGGRELSFRDLLSLTPVLPPPDAHRLLRPMTGVITVVKQSPELHMPLILWERVEVKSSEENSTPQNFLTNTHGIHIKNKSVWRKPLYSAKLWWRQKNKNHGRQPFTQNYLTWTFMPTWVETLFLIHEVNSQEARS